MTEDTLKKLDSRLRGNDKKSKGNDNLVVGGVRDGN
jgi:hypothetical protein